MFRLRFTFHSHMKTWIVNTAKFLVTAAIILFLFSRVDLATMARHLAQANLFVLLTALALYFLAIVLGVLKWQLLVRAQGLEGSLGDLLTYSFVGLFFGNLLPGSVGGDVVRGYGLARATGRAEAAAISVLVDRLMGLAAFLVGAVIMAVVAAVTLTRGGELEQVEIVMALTAVVFVAGTTLLFSRRLSERWMRIFDWAPLARIKPIANKIQRALQVYRHSYRALALNFALSGSIVVVTTLAWYAVGVALGLDVSLFYFFLFNPLIAIVVLIPISLNGLGPKEATAVFFFGLVGVPGELALAMSLIFHLLIVLTSLPGGILWLREKALSPQSPLTP